MKVLSTMSFATQRDIMEDPGDSTLKSSGYSERDVFEASNLQAAAGRLKYSAQTKEDGITDEQLRAADDSEADPTSQTDEYKQQVELVASLRAQSARNSGAGPRGASIGKRHAVQKLAAELMVSVDERVAVAQRDVGGQLRSLEAKLDQAADGEQKLMEMLEKLSSKS